MWAKGLGSDGGFWQDVQELVMVRFGQEWDFISQKAGNIKSGVWEQEG